MKNTPGFFFEFKPVPTDERGESIMDFVPKSIPCNFFGQPYGEQGISSDQAVGTPVYLTINRPAINGLSYPIVFDACFDELGRRINMETDAPLPDEPPMMPEAAEQMPTSRAEDCHAFSIITTPASQKLVPNLTKAAESLELVNEGSNERFGIPYRRNNPRQVNPLQRRQTAPTPLQLAEEVKRRIPIRVFEEQMYSYNPVKCYYEVLSRHTALTLITTQLRDLIAEKGNMYQVKEIYEFLLHDGSLIVTGHTDAELIPFLNGVLDIRSRTFREGRSPEEFFTWSLQIPFDPLDMNCPVFCDMLYRIAGGDTVHVNRTWELIGYLLIPGKDHKHIGAFSGASGAGKSVLANTISLFFDPGLISNVGAQQLNERFPAHNLVGKRLNICMDLPSGKIPAKAVGFLKQVTGGDGVYVEAKYADGHSAHLNCKFLFGSNHEILPAESDDAFLDRIVLIPFRYPVPPEEQDHDLLEKLKRELPGIFNCALAAYFRLELNHFQFTGEGQYGIRAVGMSDNQDTLLEDFINNCCTEEAGCFTSTSTLYAAYCRYCEARGYIVAENCQSFSRRFNYGTRYDIRPFKHRIDGVPTNGYVGIRLIEEEVM